MGWERTTGTDPLVERVIGRVLKMSGHISSRDSYTKPDEQDRKSPKKQTLRLTGVEPYHTPSENPLEGTVMKTPLRSVPESVCVVIRTTRIPK